MSKTPINERFVNCVNYLIENNIEVKKGDIAKKINIKNAKFSEILNFRMNVGIEEIISICDNYNFNLNYIITGKGEMYSSIHQVAEPREEIYKKEISNEEDLMKSMININKTIVGLINPLSFKVEQLQKRIEDLEESNNALKIIYKANKLENEVEKEIENKKSINGK